MEIRRALEPRRHVALPLRGLARHDGGEGAIAVFIDDRVVRAQICDRVRSRDLFALPITTGLGAVLTLERARPKIAVLADPALGAPVRELIEFLADEYPATERVLLGGRMNGWLADHVTEWARDLVELDALLDDMRP
jgi:Na+-translocating ferredoxin:NAD+ oxidoreductase RnfC subunit